VPYPNCYESTQVDIFLGDFETTPASEPPAHVFAIQTNQKKKKKQNKKKTNKQTNLDISTVQTGNTTNHENENYIVTILVVKS
jgi:hypothetical protein